jgi:hypothetical protein
VKLLEREGCDGTDVVQRCAARPGRGGWASQGSASGCAGRRCASAVSPNEVALRREVHAPWSGRHRSDEQWVIGGREKHGCKCFGRRTTFLHVMLRTWGGLRGGGHLASVRKLSCAGTGTTTWGVLTAGRPRHLRPSVAGWTMDAPRAQTGQLPSALLQRQRVPVSSEPSTSAFRRDVILRAARRLAERRGTVWAQGWSRWVEWVRAASLDPTVYVYV